MCILYKDNFLPNAIDELGQSLISDEVPRWVYVFLFACVIGIPCALLFDAWQMYYQAAFIFLFLIVVLFRIKLGPLIQELGECKFCINFWSSSIIAIAITLYTWNPNYIFWGLYASSIKSLFDK